MIFDWAKLNKLATKSFKCGFCQHAIAAENGYYAFSNGASTWRYIYICHHCERPNFFDEFGKQTPGPSYGDEVEGIQDKSVLAIYKEARDCFSISAYSAVAMCCRKMLMHMAISQGAKENLQFVEYVNYLYDSHLIPVNSKKWVDEIRVIGNDTNHEITIVQKGDAMNLLNFVSMIAKMIYEFPNKISSKKLSE